MEIGKQSAAESAVDAEIMPLLVPNGDAQKLVILGIGSGSTIVHAVRHLSQRVSDTKTPLLPFACIPTSYQSRQLCIDHNLPLTSLDIHTRVHVTVDGADEVDNQLNCLKGGGGCHVQEKLVAFNSDKLVLIVDERKLTDGHPMLSKWKKGIPVEVLPSAWRCVRQLVEASTLFRAALRTGTGKAGPVVTDKGNFILDLTHSKNGTLTSTQIVALDSALCCIPGIVGTGLFPRGMVSCVYIGCEDGTTKVQQVHSREAPDNHIQKALRDAIN